MKHTMGTCRCIIKHPANKEQRDKIAERLDYFRRIGDTQGTMLCIAQLTSKCAYAEKMKKLRKKSKITKLKQEKG